MEQCPRTAVGAGNDILPAGSNQAGTDVRRKPWSLCLDVWTEDFIRYGITDRIAPVIVGIRRIEQVVFAILLPKSRRFDEDAFPGLIDTEKLLRFSLKS